MIIRNLGVKKVLADNGDAIGVREYIHLLLLPARLAHSDPIQSTRTTFGLITAMSHLTWITIRTIMMVLLM